MARLFAIRVAEGRTQWAQVPPKLRQAVADILVGELGLLGLVPAEYGGIAEQPKI